MDELSGGSSQQQASQTSIPSSGPGTQASQIAIPTSRPPVQTIVIYHDPNAGAAAVGRYNEAIELLKAARIPYTQVLGDVQAKVDELAGVTGSVLARFFLGDPTAEGWTSQPKVNNGGLRWLKTKIQELTSN